jgi:hypothetical protein
MIYHIEYEFLYIVSILAAPNSSAQISSCLFNSTRSGSYGSSIFVNNFGNSKMLIQNSVFTGSSSTDGGCFLSYDVDLIIFDSYFVDCVSKVNAGALIHFISFKQRIMLPSYRKRVQWCMWSMCQIKDGCESARPCSKCIKKGIPDQFIDRTGNKKSSGTRVIYRDIIPNYHYHPAMVDQTMDFQQQQQQQQQEQEPKYYPEDFYAHEYYPTESYSNQVMYPMNGDSQYYSKYDVTQQACNPMQYRYAAYYYPSNKLLSVRSKHE